MSYREAKLARHRALVAGIHGVSEEPESASEPEFDGGVRTDQMPPSERRLPPSWPSDERGWGPEYELEDGAELFFPWLRERDE